MDKLDKEELAEVFVARLRALARSGGADLRELDREFYGFSVRLGVRYDFAGKFSVSQINGGESAQLHFADIAQFEAHARECLRAASADAELSEAFMLRLRADPQKAATNADQIIKFHDFKPFSVQLRCEYCGGSGRRRCKACEGAGKAPCANCGGRGRLICPDCKGTGGYSRAALSSTDTHARGLSAGSASNSMGYRFIPCASCGGSGSRICPACGGAGRLRCEKCGGAGDFRCEHCDGRGYFTRIGKVSVYARPSVSIGASSQVFGRELLEFLCSKGVGFAVRRLLFRLSSLRSVQGGCEAVFSAEDDFLRLSFAVCGKAYDAACFGGVTFVRPNFFDEVFAPELAAVRGAPARLGRDDAQSLFALFRAKPVLDAAMRLASAKLRGETLNLEQLRGSDGHFNSVNSTCSAADRDDLSLAKDAPRKENLEGGTSVKFAGTKFASASANSMGAEDNRLGLRGEQGRFAGGVSGGIKFAGADLLEGGENSASDFEARQQGSEAFAQNGSNFAGSQEGSSGTSDRAAEDLCELHSERDYRDLSVLNAQNSTNSIDSAAINSANSENLAAAKFKNRANTQSPAASNSKISPFARLKKFFSPRSLREDCAQSFAAAIMRVCEGFISQQCARDLGGAMAGALGVLSPRYDRAVWCIGGGALTAAAALACEGCFEMIFAEHYFWALACGAVIAAAGLLGGGVLWLASAVRCVVKARKIPREYRCGRGGAAFARFCKALLCAVLASAIYGGAANTGYVPKTGAAGLLRGWMPAFFEDENSASASDGVNSADENSTSASSSGSESPASNSASGATKDSAAMQKDKILYIQKSIGVKQDGIFGARTLKKAREVLDQNLSGVDEIYEALKSKEQARTNPNSSNQTAP
ncbi:hypothetical protein [uncultured Campylobacter sp.]|uniref:hypothetical protein n=1 Tax=uncultured Campylobacter sp. TaxID=218934 RepID=UPI0026277523|nr:hypothetical protein [uncultured Campylobacter sp.]